jgi:HK97 gp10 family phage protein
MQMKGADELNKNILELTKTIAPEKVEPILHEGAKVVADAARANAPVGPTGNLRRGIVDKVLQRKGQDKPAPAMAGIDYRIAPHAHLVEFGTAERYPKKKTVLYDKSTGQFFGTHVGPMPAHPFFRPAWDDNKDRIEKQIIDQIWNAILETTK